MASSVARMPTAAADADPLRHPAANLNLNLKKVATRHKTRERKDSHEAASSSSSSSSPRILDRWAERQARDMITTLERQAHEAELSALSTTSQPVSARAATFLRETSPSPSPPSLSDFSSSVGNVRASSLIQMWREMEADAGGRSSAPSSPGSEHSVRSLTEKAAAAAGGSSCCVVRMRCRREMEDLVGMMRNERMREVLGLAGLHKVSRFSHRGPIQSMLKLRFLRNDVEMQNQAQPVSRKKEPKKLSDTGVTTISFLRERFDNQIQNDSGIPAKKRSSTVNTQFPIDSQDSCSAHSADQSSIENNQYQEIISIEGSESLPPDSTSPQSRSEDLQAGSPIAELSALHSRTEELNEANQGHDFGSLDSISIDRDERSQSLELNSLIPASEHLREGRQSPELSSLQRSEYLQEECQSPELDLLRLRSEDFCDISQSPEASWDERNLWVGNLDWQRTLESPNVDGWQSELEIAPGELESYAPQDILTTGHIWMGDSSRSWRSWEVHSPEYHDYSQTFSDNTEIRELLERKRVTTSLESDFCDEMNRVIMRFLQIQGEQYVDENFPEEYGEQPTRRRSFVFNSADQAASASSFVPSSYRTTMHYPDSLQHTSFTHHSSHNLQESENVHDMKKEMARMRQEISDLRKLVESCMDWQAKVHGSIKDEVSSAVHQSVLVAKTSEGSKRPSSQKDSCCVCCHEMQVDSLLYRCGHMCTCFKCAHELQWSGGACPICQAPIVDVVQAYPDTR